MKRKESKEVSKEVKRKQKSCGKEIFHLQDKVTQAQKNNSER